MTSKDVYESGEELDESQNGVFNSLGAAELCSETTPPPSQSLQSHQCLGVGVGLLVHDDLCHLVVAAVGGYVQRRQVVVGHVVHGHLVVQQQLDTVEMVALRRHVQRRQAVLKGRGVEPPFLSAVEAEKMRTLLRGKYLQYLGLGEYRSPSVQQHLHHLLMAAPRAAVERSQTVL